MYVSAMKNKTYCEYRAIPAIRAAKPMIIVNGCCFLQSIPLRLGKRHVLTSRKPVAKISSAQIADSHQIRIGSPFEKCTTEAITPAPAGVGMPTKYFCPGLPG